MSHISNYCYIDNQKSTNECSDPNYIRIYNNKDSEVSKLNYYPPPPSMSPGPLRQKNSFNPGDSYSNKEVNTNFSPVTHNTINTNTNLPISNNSTLSYAQK
jgi:hypothetical protein